jgi:hypothetical protein
MCDAGRASWTHKKSTSMAIAWPKSLDRQPGWAGGIAFVALSEVTALVFQAEHLSPWLQPGLDLD